MLRTSRMWHIEEGSKERMQLWSINEEYVMLFQHFIVSTSWFCFRMFVMRFAFYRYVECQKCYLAVPETRLAAHQKSKDCRRCKQHGLLRCPLCFLTVEPGDKGWREHILKQPGCLQNPRPLIHASWTCATLNPKPYTLSHSWIISFQFEGKIFW